MFFHISRNNPREPKVVEEKKEVRFHCCKSPSFPYQRVIQKQSGHPVASFNTLSNFEGPQTHAE